MKTTKELARELGFLRKRTYSTSGSDVGKRGLTDQPFRYLIVIDFESTCWQDTKFKAQEIIEFPAVLLNTMSGQIESEFHFYVQPQEHPVLSSFCTELTGITQSRVDDGIPISLCLRKFTHWLDKLYREKNVVCEGTKTDRTMPVNCTFVTWSDWDLGVCLQYECKRKQLLKPAQLNSWIDLRATYRTFYDRKPNGLNGALQDLGIEFQGREHSGVDDARNTAKLAYRMIRDGCILKTTKVLKTHERSSSCITQFRAGSNQNRQTQVVQPQQTDIRAFTDNKQTPLETKRTPEKPVRNKLNQTPKKSKQTPEKSKQMSEKSKQIPKKSKQTPQKLKQTPQKSENARATPAKIKSTAFDRIDTCDLGKPKTPVKTAENLKKTQKRKLNTPIKTVLEKSSCSPCRKVPRRVSPKKFSVDDIYIDQEESTGSGCSNLKKNKASLKTGLQLCDMNVLVNKDMVSSMLSTKHTRQNRSINTTSALSKQPNPKLKDSHQQDNSTFKVPLPVGKSPSPRRSVQKNFCTSTPVNENKDQRMLIQGTDPSPIQTGSMCSGQSGRSYNSSNGVSSFSINKTPSGTSQNTKNSSLSSFATPSIPSFMKTNSYSSFGSACRTEVKMKVTPPLCNCGRRSKRRMVQSPGQNMGRFFFTCAIRHSVASKTGCDFFKWESSLGFNRNSSEKNLSKQFTPVMGNRSASMSASGSQKRSLGVRSMNSQRVYLR